MNSKARFNKNNGSHFDKYNEGYYWENEGEYEEWEGLEYFWEEYLEKNRIFCKECYTIKLAIETKIRQ